MPGLWGGLGPRHLEAAEGLVEVGLGHLPGEAARDVGVLQQEGCGKVFGLGEHLGERWTWGVAETETGSLSGPVRRHSAVTICQEARELCGPQQGLWQGSGRAFCVDPWLIWQWPRWTGGYFVVT